MNPAKIGIFFVVQGHLLMDAAPLEQGELYGDAINFSGHFDYWDSLKPSRAVEQLFKNHAYDYFPPVVEWFISTKPTVSSFMLTVASQKLKLKKSPLHFIFQRIS
jgi:hypothetical protein